MDRDNYQFTTQYQIFLDDINKSNFTWLESGNIFVIADLLEQTRGNYESSYDIIDNVISKYIYLGDEYEGVFRDALISAGYTMR